MGAAFKKGRKARLITKQVQRAYRKRAIAITILSIFGLALGFFLLIRYLEQSWQLPERGEKPVKDVFDAQLVYEKAQALIEAGRAHEFKGRKKEVQVKYKEALELLDLLKKKEPYFKKEEVAKEIHFLEDKLRRAK